MILVIDNFDSFTYNLVQYLRQLGAVVEVRRNNALTIPDIEQMAPEAIVISPGPGRPESAGITLDVICRFSGKLPLLGVCLGHQAIAMAFQGEIVAARRLMHGKTSTVTADGKQIYRGIRRPFQAMRYHSLAVARETLPACFAISAEAEDGEIMGLRHLEHPTEGVQFHPESIMTPVGKRLLRNFLETAGTLEKGPVAA
jgi:anthranilate synthase/aminodeoxychorismate synthase-like glutamine amidotransferase